MIVYLFNSVVGSKLYICMYICVCNKKMLTNNIINTIIIFVKSIKPIKVKFGGSKMKFAKVTKRMKKLFTIASEGNIRMAIEWDVIDDVVSINWCTVNEKLYNLQDSNIKDKFIEKTLIYFKSSDKYLEVLKKYNMI